MEFAVLDWSPWTQTHSASAKTAKFLQKQLNFANSWKIWVVDHGVEFQSTSRIKTIKEEFPSKSSNLFLFLFWESEKKKKKSSNFSGDNFEFLIYLVIL